MRILIGSIVVLLIAITACTDSKQNEYVPYIIQETTDIEADLYTSESLTLTNTESGSLVTIDFIVIKPGTHVEIWTDGTFVGFVRISETYGRSLYPTGMETFPPMSFIIEGEVTNFTEDLSPVSIPMGTQTIILELDGKLIGPKVIILTLDGYWSEISQ